MRFIVIVIFLANTSCSKKVNTSATVKIQFDQSVVGNTPYSNKVSEKSDDDDFPDWGLPDPTSLGDIHCYGVFVHGNEPELKHSACQLGDNNAISFGPRAGFYPIGRHAELEVLAGLNRTIYLLGMSSANGYCQSDFETDSEVNDANYSNPFIVGRVTVDLADRVNVVEIPLINEFISENKILNCDFFDENDALKPANLTISELSPHNFGNLVLGTQISQLFKVVNNGSQKASSISVLSLSNHFSYTGGAYPGTSGTCGLELPAQGDCFLDISYAPVVAGNHEETLNFSYFNGLSDDSLTFQLKGFGKAPASLNITGTSEPYVYPPQVVGNLSQKTFTITNNGQTQATNLMEINGALNIPFSFSGGTYSGSGSCGSTLNAGDSCVITVEFLPGNSIFYSDHIEISYNNGANTVNLNFQIQGMGVSPALLTISESDPFSFPTTNSGSTSSHIFTVTNVGGYDASTISEGGLFPPYSVNWGTSTCTSNIPPGSSCDLVVEFSPTLIGTHNDTIELDYNDGQNFTQVIRNVNGIGQ